MIGPLRLPQAKVNDCFHKFRDFADENQSHLIIYMYKNLSFRKFAVAALLMLPVGKTAIFSDRTIIRREWFHGAFENSASLSRRRILSNPTSRKLCHDGCVSLLQRYIPLHQHLFTMCCMIEPANIRVDS